MAGAPATSGLVSACFVTDRSACLCTGVVVAAESLPGLGSVAPVVTVAVLVTSPASEDAAVPSTVIVTGGGRGLAAGPASVPRWQVTRRAAMVQLPWVADTLVAVNPDGSGSVTTASGASEPAPGNCWLVT